MVRKISRRSFLVYFNIGWLAGCFPLVLSACQPKSPDSDFLFDSLYFPVVDRERIYYPRPIKAPQN
jgi:hypothetical protein